MSELNYTLEKAACLLDVAPQELQTLVDQNRVETVIVSGERRIPKHEIARLFNKLGKVNAEEEPLESDPVEDRSVARNDTDGLPVEDEELLRLYDEVNKTQARIRNLGEKMKRLGVRLNRLRAIEAGDMARFWERASAVYPQLWGEAQYGLDEVDGRPVIVRTEAGADDDYKQRFREMVMAGIRKGHLPQGFLGIFLKPGQDEGGEQEEQ